MGIEQRLRAARCFEPRRFLAVHCDGERLGWVRRDLAVHLVSFPDVFASGVERIDMFRSGGSHAERSSAMETVARELAARGVLTRWRNERYAIGPPGGEASFFALERAAVRFFGFAAQAVHLNGLTNRAGERAMWIARRSRFKPIDPGMFDNLTGGGIGGGLGIEQTLIKEMWEEAGIPAEIARRAVRAGAIDVCREVPDGLHAETIHMYDLELPSDFDPVNQDGEVEEFRCLPLGAVVAELEGDAPYTVDAGLVAIDCLRRCGVLAADASAQ